MLLQGTIQAVVAGEEILAMQEKEIASVTLSANITEIAVMIFQVMHKQLCSPLMLQFQCLFTLMHY